MAILAQYISQQIERMPARLELDLHWDQDQVVRSSGVLLCRGPAGIGGDERAVDVARFVRSQEEGE